MSLLHMFILFHIEKSAVTESLRERAGGQVDSKTIGYHCPNKNIKINKKGGKICIPLFQLDFYDV